MVILALGQTITVLYFGSFTRLVLLFSLLLGCACLFLPSVKDAALRHEQILDSL